MSSLRNAVKRITHKERSQPRGRSHLGILEKKKDYKERSKDYHSKQDRIKRLKEKAAARNPDEFYFGMHNSEIRDGKHRKTMQAKQKEMEDQIGPAAVKIMKEQDLSYVRMQIQMDRKKVERLQSSLHHLEGTDNKRKHTVFVDTPEQAENFDVVNHFGTVEEFAGRAFNRPRKERLEQTAKEGYNHGDADDNQQNPTEEELREQRKLWRKTARKLARARASAYGELEARAKRITTLERAEAHLVTEKLVAGKGRKRKIKEAENGQPAVYKWRRKRAK